MNLKFRFFLRSVLLITLFNLWSCQNSQDNVFDNVSDNQVSVNAIDDFSSIEMSNTNNPYDYIGEQHNQALDYFINNIGNNFSPNMDKMDIVNSMDAFLKETSPNSTYTEFYLDNESFFADYHSAENKTAFFLSRGLINSLQASYLDTLDEIRFDDTFEYLSIAYINKVISDTKILEGNILEDSNFSDVEKRILLIATSVQRYSIIYWGNQVVDVNNPWGLDKNNVSLKSNIDIGGSDVKGAVSGGLVGAVTGASVSFGTLTLPGWATGAILGGGGMSVGEAARGLWHWIWGY